MLLIDFATFLEDIELDRRYGNIRRTSAIWEQKDQMLNMLGLWLTTLPAEIMMQDLHFESINGGRMKMRTKNFDSYPCNLHKDAIRDTD